MYGHPPQKLVMLCQKTNVLYVKLIVDTWENVTGVMPLRIIQQEWYWKRYYLMCMELALSFLICAVVLFLNAWFELKTQKLLWAQYTLKTAVYINLLWFADFSSIYNHWFNDTWFKACIQSFFVATCNIFPQLKTV